MTPQEAANRAAKVLTTAEAQLFEERILALTKVADSWTNLATALAQNPGMAAYLNGGATND